MASKKYIKDYDLVETEDEKGRIRKTIAYHGEYFGLNLEASRIKQLKQQFVLFFVLAFGLHIGAGFINNPGLYKMYIALPYTGAFFPLMFLAAGILRIPNEKRPYRNEEIGLSYNRVVNMSRLYLIITAVGLVGWLIYLIFASHGRALGLEVIYLGLVSVAAVLIWMIFSRTTQVKIETEETPLTNE